MWQNTIPFQVFADFWWIILVLSSWPLRNYKKLLGIYIFVVAIRKCKKFWDTWRIESSGCFPNTFSLFAENVTLNILMSHRHVNQHPLSSTKIRTFHTEIITSCHSSNGLFYQLPNARARGIPFTSEILSSYSNATCLGRSRIWYGMDTLSCCHQSRHLLTSPCLMYSKTQISSFATR